MGQEDPQDKKMATYSSTLAWEIPWKEEPVHVVAKSQIQLSTQTSLTPMDKESVFLF